MVKPAPKKVVPTSIRTQAPIAAALKATKSVKENARPQTQARSMSAKTVTTNLSTQPKVAARNSLPAQRRTHSSHKDLDPAVLLATIAAKQAEIDRLNKIQAAKAVAQQLEEIPRPKKITSLQDAMGLTDHKKLYTHCRATVRDVMGRAGLPYDVKWQRQDLAEIAKVTAVARSRSSQLQRYAGNWATHEILKTLLKNRRSYKKRIGSPDEDYMKSDGEGIENEEDQDEERIEDNEDEDAVEKGVEYEDEDAIEKGIEYEDEPGLEDGTGLEYEDEPGLEDGTGLEYEDEPGLEDGTGLEYEDGTGLEYADEIGNENKNKENNNEEWDHGNDNGKRGAAKDGIVTRSGKRRKVDSGVGDQVATKSAPPKKNVPRKGKNSKK